MAEMTISEWLKKMAEAGFSGKFEASNGEMTIKGFLSEGVVKVTNKLHKGI